MPRLSFHHLAFSLLAAALLSGCGPLQEKPITSVATTTTTTTAPATPATTPGSPILGNVHGGQDPIVGAHIYLFAANPAGYGAPSISMLNPAQPNVAFDGTGYYVLTDGNGFFHISGDYSCTSGQQVYLLALGGNPGLPAGQTNPAISLMAALGACPEGQTNFASSVPYIVINEVSTVGAVYALSGFMTDATHLSSSSTPGALQGLANAFLTVTNLVDTGSGTAHIQTVQGNGDVPQAEINSLANLLVTCVNSDGGDGCTPLFSNAPDLSGVAPTNTISAALNITRKPGANVAALFTASQITKAFQPALIAAPNDWTVALTFYADKMVGPYFPAIDSIGNIWIPAYGSNTLIEFDPTGANLSGQNGFAGGGLNLPYSIAIDTQDNPWVVNFGPVNASTISKFSTTGAALVSSPYACDTQCFFPAFDAAQNLWISGAQRATVLRPDGSVLKKFTTSAFDSGIAINSGGIGWSIGQPNLLYHFGLPATLTTTSEFTTASGSDLTSVAIDSADKVWYASNKNNAIGVSDKNGILVSPANGYTGGGLKGPAQ
ncbi:MAG: hypothetical protein JWQ49_1158, partial [Edaphobacter sp.]|nr:hypothetical protein [Edaphobacter sp.]